ncbi:MAG: hypothetical protein ABJH68_03325 [Ilumatobacter sp.]|uniref:hypothetical protein n=1 Tax=Ilumatobacter sp. TaxID=1967498 RepID=UPI003297F774
MSQTATGRSSRWPTGTEYAASVQQPSTSFSDPELQTGRLTLTPLGIPASASGQNAIAFHMQAADRPVAVRCLLSANDDGRLRYRALEEHVEAYHVPAVVAATWLDEGVRVHGQWWPVVVMPWVSGDPLHIAIEDRLDDPARLSRLADRWLDLVEILQDKEFAHGDYQHGNVLLTDDDVFELVDLDGIWVPDMGVGPPNEYGHPNYQHVNRSDTDWGPYVDTFSALVIALSMLALSNDQSLSRFMTGENLLFVKTDFEEPDTAEVWKALAKSSSDEVVDLTGRLHAFARAGRPPAMSVREALDASFDPSALGAEPDSAQSPTVTGGLPVTAATNEWWNAGGPTSTPPGPSIGPPAGADSYWKGGTDTGIAASQPPTPGAPGPVAVRPGPAAPSPSAPGVSNGGPPPQAGLASQVRQPAPSGPPGVISPAAARASAPRRSGLAKITGQPVLAGLVSGAVAGLVGSILGGILQAISTEAQLDGGLFVGMIAAMLGGMVHSWPALNLSNYTLALRRFLIGAAVGLVAGIVAVFVADVMTRATLSVGDTRNAVLVAYVWALTAALVGLAIGLLRSPKAAAYAFSGGAIAGFVGGLVHGATSAEFENRALKVNGFDGQVLLIASFVAMLIGVLVAVAIRTARNGSLTVIEGPGQGTVIDFHTNKVTLGGSSSDTLVVKGRDLASRAVQMDIGDHHAEVTSDISVLVDGALQPRRFAMYSGQVMAVAGVFIRLEIKSESGQGVRP